VRIVHEFRTKHIRSDEFFNGQQNERFIGCKIGFVNACCNGKILKEEYSGGERINWKNYSNTTWPPNIVWRDSAFAWRLKNYVVIGRIKNWDCRMKMICSSVDRELFPRIGGTEKNLSMTIANQIVRRLIVRRMARPNWYEEW